MTIRKLNQGQIDNRAWQLAHLIQELASLEAQKKEEAKCFTEASRSLKKRIAALSEVIVTGEEIEVDASLPFHEAAAV